MNEYRAIPNKNSITHLLLAFVQLRHSLFARGILVIADRMSVQDLDESDGVKHCQCCSSESTFAMFATASSLSSFLVRLSATRVPFTLSD